MVTAIGLVGCSPGDDELRRAALDDAVAATFEGGAVAFTLSIDAPEEALEGFGEQAGPLAGLLAGSSAAGVLEEDRLAAGLELAGVDAVQVRVTGPGEQFLRFNLVGADQAVTGPVGRRIDAALAEAGLDAEAEAAVLAAVTGAWVGLEVAASDGPTVATSMREALAAVLREAEPSGHVGSLEETPFDGQLDVEVDVAAALAVGARALAGIAPSALPTAAPAEQSVSARMLVEAGVIRSIVLELGAVAGDAIGDDADPDDVELVLELRRLEPPAPLVEAPEAAATITVEELERAVDALGQLAPGLGTGSDDAGGP